MNVAAKWSDNWTFLLGLRSLTLEIYLQVVTSTSAAKPYGEKRRVPHRAVSKCFPWSWFGVKSSMCMMRVGEVFGIRGLWFLRRSIAELRQQEMMTTDTRLITDSPSQSSSPENAHIKATMMRLFHPAPQAFLCFLATRNIPCDQLGDSPELWHHSSPGSSNGPWRNCGAFVRSPFIWEGRHWSGSGSVTWPKSQTRSSCS